MSWKGISWKRAARYVPVLFGLMAIGWYRGEEYIQRDFNVDAEYYVDLQPILPTIEDRQAWWRATNAYFGSAGSYTRSDLFNKQQLKLDVPFSPPFGFRFDFVADQDFDGIYHHYLLGLDYRFGGAWSVALVGEPLAQKEYADIGAALRRRGDGSFFNLMLLLPDFSFDRKNSYKGTLEQKPVNLQLEAVQKLTDTLDFFTRVDIDFPLEIRYEYPQFVFDYESRKPSAGLIWRVKPEDLLWCEVGGEYTDKERRSFSRISARDFHTIRRVHEARAEYVRHAKTRHRRALGFNYVHIEEDNDYPNDPDQIGLLEDLTHRSRMLYGTLRAPVGRQFYFETGLVLDYVSHGETRPWGRDPVDSSKNGIQGKVPLTVGWQLGPHRVSAGISVQVDAPAFGGGYASGLVVF
ncbi:MAG: hypothetical protein BWY59_00534 [Verrucomicrobia bacterium ADurb.Bin345]|nr:MAG: hypothetical protein BWY59_00534 [Verrucomicrobia bacterium ADurb.Bin345]